ncbi:hypothetical protein BJX66DRAFT_108178 [Aspergillus keveii]|uniref:GPI anchored protein n=1 Tax=Aspergillus keveii TaxID=714993 RepID=A0ABR4GE03_9EURO
MIMDWVDAGFIALALGLLPGIMAQDFSKCSGLGTYYHTIERQADVDALVETDCSQLNGQIIIKQAYSGPFTFPGLTNMTGRGIQLEEGSHVTSIDFPDLEALEGSLELNAGPSLAKVSMPKLEEVPGTLFGRFPLDVELDFQSLTSVNGLDIIGNFTSLQFESLETVLGVLQVCNSEGCDSEALPPHSTMYISLPALEVAHAFYVEGRASQISAPKLRSIAGTDSGSDMEQGATPLGLMLNLTGPVSINFPDITRVEPLAAISGEIARWEALSR